MTARVDAGGTRLRLRALVALGHSSGRIARALGVHRATVCVLLNGQAATVSEELRGDACRLFDAWWDKVPPGRTRAARAAAAASRHRAQRAGWCCPLGLDDDEIDVPGYRPKAEWRPATGTGVAADDPLRIGRAAA